MCVWLQFLKASHTADAEEDINIRFTFKDNDGFIELVLNEKEKDTFTGWSIYPHVSPTLVSSYNSSMY